jgi:hypothetical protein
MNNYMKLTILMVFLGLTGCDTADEIKNNVNDRIDDVVERAKAKYGELHGDGTTSESKPFTVVFQDNPSQRSMMVSALCDANQNVDYAYFNTPADTQWALAGTQGFISYPGNQKPFWDIRYVNHVTDYMNGGTYDYYANHAAYTGLDTRTGDRNIGIGTAFSQNDASGSMTQSECVNGLMAGGSTINLFDAPDQFIHYGGPQNTFIYQMGDSSLSSPWKEDGTGNLAVEAFFDKPLYVKDGNSNNVGGSISFGIYLTNKNTGVVLNYVIGVYAAGEAWVQEKRGILFDPTQRFIHVGTVISDDSWWTTKSPQSESINEIFPSAGGTSSDDGQWNHFFRFNVAHQNLQALLQELAENPPAGAEGENFGNNPADWKVTGIMLQYELEEEGGKAILSGSFRGFEASVSHNPI